MSNDVCEPIKSAGQCDAKSECTWCTNLAVPSECWLISDAKNLPPGVYNCDKLGEEDLVEELTEVTSELRRHDNHHHHNKHEKDQPHGPPFYVTLYPLILIITMIADRCFLCRYSHTLKKLETPFIAV